MWCGVAQRWDESLKLILAEVALPLMVRGGFTSSNMDEHAKSVFLFYTGTKWRNAANKEDQK